MAEIVVSAVVTVLTEKLLAGDLLKFARSEGIDSKLKNLETTLLLIQAVLAHAAQRQITEKPVEVWLLGLQDLAYDIEDVLDDMATEIMKRKWNHEESHGTTSKVMKIIPSCCTNFTPHNFVYRREISSKLNKITARLDVLFQQKNGLGLKVNVKVERSNKDVRSQQTSYVNVSTVLGREKDKDTLIGQLLGNEEACSNQNAISVVSIVGMGGLGKTTLAQVVYNDQRVKDHFELRAWVCVSDKFDVTSISKQIYQAVGGENKEFANLDQLHAALREKLSKKRFLVVLDDVWNEDYDQWDLLRKAFDVGGHGNKLLVTTRKEEVASVMGSSQPYKLQVLSDEISLSLLGQSALGEQSFDNHRLKIAQSIVEKCDGLPLALIALGRVLKRKGSHDEWEELLKSDIWNSDDKSVLPALKISYYDLPSHLKQVFAYCSLFPKDYEFKKKKLVLLWMAQGFLSQHENQPMESLGDKYFKELLSRSFFQPSRNDASRYIMHDLMNDLATSVAGEFVFRFVDNMDLNGSNKAYEKCRHFSFIGEQRVTEYKKFKEIHKARCLRTFLPVSMPVCLGGFHSLDTVTVELLPRLHFLRVLSLTNWSITEVPQSIGNLTHLRYVNFSKTDIRQIPKQVSELYNLQSLLVRECNMLSSLPVSFERLINLRHLDMTDTDSLKKLPLGIGRLKSLQTLSKVVIQEDNGFKVSDLKDLQDLQGALSIQGLEKVTDPTNAEDANLEQKKGLDDLELVWGDATTNEDDVIEKLRPHSNLKTLCIKGYGGMQFPSWLRDSSFNRLTKLVLSECNNLTELTLGHLTSLRKLQVTGCSKLESIKGEKDVVNVGSSIMGSLTEVRLSNCHSLKSYCCPHSVEKLEIFYCNSMTSLNFSKLQEGLPSSSSNLKSLFINSCKKIKSISQEHLQSLTSLENLDVYYCPEYSFPSCGLWPPNLKRLSIGALKKPMSEWGLQNYPSSLVKLSLNGKNSGVVSFGKMKEDHINISSTCFLLPPSLNELCINGFEEVESVSEVLQHLPHLQELHIINCPKLRDVPETTSSLKVYEMKVIKVEYV